MKFENEITVEVDTTLEILKQLLENNNFNIIEEYDLNDIYMIDKKYKKEKNYIEMLKYCVLIRHIIEDNRERKQITYKYKEYGKDNEIIRQSKVDCQVDSIEDAQELLEALNYEEIIRLYDHLIVYSNGVDELVVQLVNGKHIYIEIEDICRNTKKKYKSIEEMKEIIQKCNIPTKSNNYFVKKAEIEMIENFK